MITPDNIRPFNGNPTASTVKSPVEATTTPHSNTHASQTTQNTTLSIESVLSDMDQWRQNKSHFKEPIPDQLWQKIFTLAQQHGEKRIRSVFGLSTERYQKKYQALHPEQSTTPKSTPQKNTPNTGVEFCEVKTKHPIFEPLQIPSNTVIAEFRRADGHVMKIHCLSDRFQDIINAFLQGEGESHAANHTQA